MISDKENIHKIDQVNRELLISMLEALSETVNKTKEIAMSLEKDVIRRNNHFNYFVGLRTGVRSIIDILSLPGGATSNQIITHYNYWKTRKTFEPTNK